MKYLMNMGMSVLSVLVIIAPTCMAQSINQPVENLEQYDLIAKVKIEKISTNRELKYIDTLETQAYGYPVEWTLVEPILIPENISDLHLLIQGYGYFRGVKQMPPAAFLEAAGDSNIIAVAGQIYSDTNMLVIVKILQEGEWNYHKDNASKEEQAPPPFSADVQTHPSERIQALQQRIVLRKKMQAGEISEEEYQEQLKPLNNIINRPNVIMVL